MSSIHLSDTHIKLILEAINKLEHHYKRHAYANQKDLDKIKHKLQKILNGGIEPDEP